MNASDAAVGAVGARSPAFFPMLIASMRGHAIFLALSASYLAILVLLQFAVPAMTTVSFLAVGVIVVCGVIVLLIDLLCYEFFHMAIYQRPKHPIPQLFRNMAALLGDGRRLAAGLPMFLSLMVFIYAFSGVKANIPVIVPFSWDRTLDQLDLALHFGKRPWEWLQPVLGHWPVTFLLNLNYNLWFFLMYGIWLYFAFIAAPGVERTRYFLCFMMVWMVGGGLMAVILSSAGPCFFGAGRLNLSPDPYVALMAYLREPGHPIPIWAPAFQDTLWAQYIDRSGDSSISAMPSLHNGTALLFALASTGWPKWLRRILWANVALIFLGSIHLAWHYAVDSYVIWAVTLAMWWAMAPVARWWEASSPARRFRLEYLRT